LSVAGSLRRAWLAGALGIALSLTSNGGFAAGARRESLALMDLQRQRSVPVELYYPVGATACAHDCPVAILSGGSGMSHLDYSFIAEALNGLGYFVVSVRHELASDPKIDVNGDVALQRRRIWERGARNIEFVQDAMATTHPQFDWRHPVLVGHSLGGDSSALRAGENGSSIPALVTLDNRRERLPRSQATHVLSIRASDTEADPDVLPSKAEAAQFGACIMKIGRARHNDMQDGGSAQLKRKIVHAIETFLRPPKGGARQYACDTPSTLD
jgi:hypothetical protein